MGEHQSEATLHGLHPQEEDRVGGQAALSSLLNQYKFAITSVGFALVALGAGIAFTLRLLLDAKDYPELQLVVFWMAAFIFCIFFAISCTAYGFFVMVSAAKSINRHFIHKPWISVPSRLSIVVIFMTFFLLAWMVFDAGKVSFTTAINGLIGEINGRIE